MELALSQMFAIVRQLVITELFVPYVRISKKKTQAKKIFIIFFIIAFCSQGCLNNGVCSSPEVCDCTGTGYNGTSCEIRKNIFYIFCYYKSVKRYLKLKLSGL